MIGATTPAARPAADPPLFLPSKQAAAVLVSVALAALAAALYMRYGVIQNTPLGLACEAGVESLICRVRLGVVLMFTYNLFGWAAVIAALIQLWRPSTVTLGIGIVFALLGLVLYNNRASALAAALLLLSLARPARETR